MECVGPTLSRDRGPPGHRAFAFRLRAHLSGRGRRTAETLAAGTAELPGKAKPRALPFVIGESFVIARADRQRELPHMQVVREFVRVAALLALELETPG